MVHPKMQSNFNLFHSTKLSIFMKASGVTDESIGDQQYVERLLLCQQVPLAIVACSAVRPSSLPGALQAAPCFGRLCLLAFSHCNADNGELDMAGTGLSTPNAYILQLHRDNPTSTWPVGSVHPYKTDAVPRSQLLHWLASSCTG